MAYTTIDDPSAYFQTTLYTGDGSASQAQTNTGNSDLQPDWIWVKKRNNVRNTSNTDSSRGFNKRVETQTTSAETTTTTDVISAQSNGFTVGNNGSTGENGDTYVAWQWKANGGTTSSNTDGSITSTVQANTTAGFSIVTYDGTGSSGATFGHGLGTVPNFIIIKNRSEVKDWAVYHSANTSAPETDALFLNLTDATIDNTGYWNDTAPTSSIITVGDNTKVNSSGEQHIAYCFKEIQGYSKFGSYTGNGNADGSFVYTGFKPAWIMIKKTNNTSQWVLHDTTRQEFNMQTRFLQANQTAAESTSSAADLDILSNGFKLRSTDDAQNGNGDTFIYMAFAEHPFVSSKGVPTTAR
jgi:hypothetical protein